MGRSSVAGIRGRSWRELAWLPGPKPPGARLLRPRLLGRRLLGLRLLGVRLLSVRLLGPTLGPTLLVGHYIRLTTPG